MCSKMKEHIFLLLIAKEYAFSKMHISTKFTTKISKIFGKPFK